MALRFGLEGARVAVNDIDPEVADETAEAVRKAGATSAAFAGDAASAPDVQEMFARITRTFEGVDIVVNNAGGDLGYRSRSEVAARSVFDVTVQDWDDVIAVNLRSAFLCSRVAAPLMVERRWGRIIMVSSLAGRTRNEASGPHYAAAKAGMLGLMRNLASQLGPHGVTVNAIAPGIVLSGERLERKWAALSDEERQGLLAAVALRRLPELDEIATVALFLASDEASYVTGAVIDVNGGRFMA